MDRWHRFQYKLLSVAGSLLARLGFDRMATFGSFLGSLMWVLVPKRRELAIRNIRQHLGLSLVEAEAVAKESFAHTGRSFTEILLTQDFGVNSPRFRTAQPDLWRDFLACERPVIAATAHMGSWELLASILGQLAEPPRPRVVVVRRYNNPAVQAFITRQREATGGTMVGHRSVAASVLKALRKKGYVAFLVDHNALRSEALFLPFLGEEAAVNMGPAVLGVRAEAVIFPVFLIREGKDYVFHLQPPLDTATLSGSREDKVRETTEFYTRAVENIIRQYPAQWFWMHNRWKSKANPTPPAPLPSPATSETEGE